jgi:hypothetical protein
MPFRLDTPRCSRHALLVWLLIFSSIPVWASKKPAPGPPVVRWNESDPACTLVKGEDGIYRYSVEYETLKLTMAVDNQELEKTKRTLEHVFRLLLTVRNRGTVPVKLLPGEASLELVQHFHIRMTSLDPDDLSARIQNDSDELVHQSERELRRHPERKEVVEKRLREHEKLVTEWLEYLSSKTLQDVTLDTGQPEVTGLVLFSTKTKWKGSWKKQEDFVLRVPVEKIIFEFPFTLPPSGEEPVLRQRPE